MSGLDTRQNAIFCLSWLANANAEFTSRTTTQKQATQDQLQNAKKYIQGGIADLRLSRVLRGFNQLAWGPAVFVNKANHPSTLKNNIAKEFFTNTLVFVVKAQLKGLYTYVIAIAGAHLFSSATGLPKDSKAISSLPWPKPNSGNIYQEMAKSLSQLLALRGDQGDFLEDFLKTELISLPNRAKAEIAIAGHRLGGTLSSVLALRIKEDLSEWNPKIHLTISAWPTAAPPPGDQLFANHLVNTLALENYKTLYDRQKTDLPPRAYLNHFFEEDEIKALMDWVPPFYHSSTNC